MNFSISNYKHYVQIILASRTNEWNAFINNDYHSKDINRLIGNTFQLTKLSEKEINKLKEFLKRQGIITAENQEELENVMQNEKQNFLLAVMIAATHGKPLTDILKDVEDLVKSV